MPPLDWSIVQSMLLFLVLPSFGVAAAALSGAVAAIKTESYRSIACSLALALGLTAGLASQNLRGELIPFLPIQSIAEQSTEDQTTPTGSTSWEVETGWRSLYAVTILAIVAEITIQFLVRPYGGSRAAFVLRTLTAIICAVGLAPWDLGTSWRWIAVVLALVILLNNLTMDTIAQTRMGPWLPLSLAIIWGGSATAVLVLSHSARFADLGILLSCALAGVGIVTLLIHLRPRSLFAGPAAYIPGLMLATALNTYSDIPMASFALVAAAPIALAFVFWKSLREWSEARPIAALLTFLIPCGVAVAMAIQAEL